MTTTSGGDVKLSATDNASIVADAGGLAVSLGFGGDAGVAVSLGVGAAVNTITDTTLAFVDDSTVSAASAVSLAANETASIVAISYGGTVSAAGGGEGGVSVGVAGADSSNSIADKVQAYINNSNGDNSVKASNGSITLKASDSPTINAYGGGLAIAGAGGGAAGVGVTVGFSAATNSVQDTVQAFIADSTVTATGNAIALTATDTANVVAYTVGGAVSGAGGGAAGVGVGAAGAGSGNTITDIVEAVIQEGSIVTTITTGDVTLMATDNPSVTANGGGVGLTGAGGGAAGVAVSLGVAAAVNSIQDTVEAFVNNSQIASAGGVSLTANETATVQAFTIGGTVAGSGGGAAGVSVTVAGAYSSNTIKNRVQADIASNSVVAAKNGMVSVSASDNSTITANGGGGGIAGAGGGVAGVAVTLGFSAATDDVENKVYAFIDGSQVTDAGKSVMVSAAETATINTITIGGAIDGAGGGIAGVAVGGAAQGRATRSPTTSKPTSSTARRRPPPRLETSRSRQLTTLRSSRLAERAPSRETEGAWLASAYRRAMLMRPTSWGTRSKPTSASRLSPRRAV